jgi:hypothetical protein
VSRDPREYKPNQPSLEWLMADPVRWRIYAAGMEEAYMLAAAQRHQLEAETAARLQAMAELVGESGRDRVQHMVDEGWFAAPAEPARERPEWASRTQGEVARSWGLEPPDEDWSLDAGYAAAPADEVADHTA